jgi:hypothetical protein
VYTLTDDGRDLGPVIDALARWGARRLTRPAEGDAVAPRWFVGALAATVDARAVRKRATFGLVIDGSPFEITIDDGTIAAAHGEPEHPVATLSGELSAFFAAAKGKRAAARRVVVGGDQTAGRQLLEAIVGCLA